MPPMRGDSTAARTRSSSSHIISQALEPDRGVDGRVEQLAQPDPQPLHRAGGQHAGQLDERLRCELSDLRRR